jgi:hypothetical protein
MATTGKTWPFTFFIASVQKRQLTCHSPSRTKWFRKTTISRHTTRKWIPICGYVAPFIYQLSYVRITAIFGQVSSMWPDAIFVRAWKDYKETGIIKVTVRATDFNPLRHEIHLKNLHFLPIKMFNRSMLFTETISVYSDSISVYGIHKYFADNMKSF